MATVKEEYILSLSKVQEIAERLAKGSNTVLLNVSEVFQRNDRNGNGRYQVQFLYAYNNKIVDITYNMFKLFRTAGTTAGSFSNKTCRVLTYENDYKYMVDTLNKYLQENNINITFNTVTCYI